MKVDLHDPRTQKLVLIILGLLAGGYYYFMTEAFSFTYRSRAMVLEELRLQRDHMSQDVSRARAVGDRLASLSREREKLAERWLELEARLPTVHDRAEFLAEITSLGRQQHLQFYLFEPKPPRSAEFYQEVGVQVQVKGSYHEVGRFLAELANLSRIVKVSSLKLTSDDQGGDDEGPAVSAEMEITTFYLRNDAGAEAPPAGEET
jgi:type IV pilus assembly protein PilO